MPLRFAFLVCALLLTLSDNVFAQDIVTDCDKYAASDTDPSAKAPGVPIDTVNSALAVRACKAAVQQFPNAPRILFQLGRAYQKAENFDSALQQYRKAAEQNYAAAQNSLGNMYADGQGVPADDQQAIAWYRKAAEQGLAAAQNNLGTMYWYGRGVPKDAQQAVAWFSKAAKQGLASAQSNLAAVQPKVSPPDALRPATPPAATLHSAPAHAELSSSDLHALAKTNCVSSIQSTDGLKNLSFGAVDRLCECTAIAFINIWTAQNMEEMRAAGKSTPAMYSKFNTALMGCAELMRQ